jgi:hypothetical protein
MLQSVVVVATEFFEYDTPDWRQYSFIGSTCLLLFCIKLLYCDDANTLASDHALLVNRAAAAFFNIGQFALLFSTTILGSGMNLLTHSYLAATAALPGNAKSLVCSGFAGTYVYIYIYIFFYFFYLYLLFFEFYHRLGIVLTYIYTNVLSLPSPSCCSCPLIHLVHQIDAS